MIKVYKLVREYSTFSYSGRREFGLYSSRPKADAARERLMRRHHDNQYRVHGVISSEYRIEEVELDKDRF